MGAWPVNQARNRWSELLGQAETSGPQVITHHGKERAVVLSIEEYRRLKPVEEKPDFITFLLSAPKIDLQDWEIERSKDTGRDFNFED